MQCNLVAIVECGSALDMGSVKPGRDVAGALADIERLRQLDMQVDVSAPQEPVRRLSQGARS